MTQLDGTQMFIKRGLKFFSMASTTVTAPMLYYFWSCTHVQLIDSDINDKQGKRRSVSDTGNPFTQFFVVLPAAMFMKTTDQEVFNHHSGIKYPAARDKLNDALEKLLNDPKVKHSPEAIFFTRLTMNGNDAVAFFGEPMPESVISLFCNQIMAHAELDANDPCGAASRYEHTKVDQHYHLIISKEFAKQGYPAGKVSHLIGYAEASCRKSLSRPLGNPGLTNLLKPKN